MTADASPESPSTEPALEHPALSHALTTLARSLDRRAEPGAEAPSYLELAVLVAGVQDRLDDLTRLLVHAARRYDGTTWQQVARALGVSRPTAYKRFGAPSPNDPAAGTPADDDDDEG